MALPPTSEKLSSQGVFLLDTGEDLLMYVGRSVPAGVLRELFGVEALPAGENVSSIAENTKQNDNGWQEVWLFRHHCIILRS